MGAQVAVLFARADSVYKTLPMCDVWDAERDARRWAGGAPVVAHPPCRAWGNLRHMAKPRPDEKALALWAVQQVRTYGGVLEHPKRSTLWPAAGLPAPGERDAYGGWTLPIFQSWWGHRAEKATLLYIVGCEPAEMPPMPLVLGEAPCVVGTGGAPRRWFARPARASRMAPGNHEGRKGAYAAGLGGVAGRGSSTLQED